MYAIVSGPILYSEILVEVDIYSEGVICHQFCLSFDGLYSRTLLNIMTNVSSKIEGLSI